MSAAEAGGSGDEEVAGLLRALEAPDGLEAGGLKWASRRATRLGARHVAA